MKKGLTELVFIIDRSGSMSGLEDDTIGGFNAMLKEQQGVEGEAVVTTVLFDDRYELLHDRIPLQGVAPLTSGQYYVRGSTALLDAIGRTIQKIANIQRHTAPDMRADKVLFVITTDGYENASREYSYEKIRSMVELEQKEYGWEFLFLGANIDAIAVAGQVGISADRAVTYHADSAGTALNYDVVSEAVSYLRACAAVPPNWKQRIEQDFRSRKSRR